MDLLLGGGEPQESVPGPALPSQDQAAGDSCESGPSSVASLRQVLLGRKVFFIPVEADIDFIRADIKFRGPFLLKRDLAAHMVARGLAVTSDSSFSPDRQVPSSSPFHYLRSCLVCRRVSSWGPFHRGTVPLATLVYARHAGIPDYVMCGLVGRVCTAAAAGKGRGST